MPAIASLVNECVEAEMTDSAHKRKLWEKLGKELEKADFPKEDISSKIQEVIEDRLESKMGHHVSIDTAYFYRIMQDNRWGLSARRLPPKSKLPSGEFEKIPKYEKVSPEHPNQKILDGITELIAGCRAIYHAVDTFEAEEDGLPPQDMKKYFVPGTMKEVLRQIKITKGIVSDCATARTKIPLRCHHLVKAILATESSMVQAGVMLLQARLALTKEYGAYFGKKQALKFTKGKESVQLDVFAPKDRDMAIYAGWYGMQCPRCDGWRLQVSAQGGADPAVLDCVDCNRPVRLPAAGVGVPQCRSCGRVLWTAILKKLKVIGKKQDVAECVCPSCEGKLLVPRHWLVALR